MELQYKDNGSNVYSGIEYMYDDGGRLTKIHWRPYLHCFDYTDIDATYDCDEANRVTKRTVEGVSWFEAEDFKAKVATSYQYDAAGQVTRLIVDNDDNPIDLDDRDFAYSYDARGNRTKTVLNNDTNKKIEYCYDDLNRLTKEQRSGTSTNYTYQYWYDAVGNRTQMVKDGTTTTYAYDDESRLRTKTTGGVNTTYEYAYNGILTREYKDANNYRYFYWDSKDRLTKVEKKVSGNTTTVEYNYDAYGRRVQKVKGADTTRYVYDGLKVAIEQVNSNTPLLYMNDSSAVGGMLARYDGSSEEAKIARVYAYDAIGNVMGYVESDMPYGYGTGTSFVQEAFGNVLSGSQSGYHLTTKEYDPDSGLYYFFARWYDPELGRFISKSPLRSYEEQPYVYCEDNPVYLTDPTGLSYASFYCEMIEIAVNGLLAILDRTNITPILRRQLGWELARYRALYDEFCTGDMSGWMVGPSLCVGLGVYVVLNELWDWTTPSHNIPPGDIDDCLERCGLSNPWCQRACVVGTK
jgi:RHS repeat-associated protein